jgi:hypothetical protein
MLHHLIGYAALALTVLVYGAGFIAACTPRSSDSKPTQSEADIHGF